MRNASKRSSAALRTVMALILALCLLMSSLPAALAATRAGMSPSVLVESATKKYAVLSRSVLLFTGETYGEGATKTADAGKVVQLVTDDWYTGDDGLNYYGVYYQNMRYNALRTDLVNDVLSAGSLETYIMNNIWKQSSYDTLRYTDNLKGDIRVHAVQLALQKLGYYTGALDGSYGKTTMNAVKSFQKANGLDDDGNAGPLTQPVLFALASGGSVSSGSSSSGSTSSGSSSTGSSSSSSSLSVPTAGSLTTTVSVNLRKSYSTSSARMAVVPAGTTLNYTNATVRSGVTWYQVEYNSIDGWLMGTYVTTKATSASPALGTVTITKGGTRVRDAANGNKTGYVLSKGTVVDLLAQPTSAGGYTWYNIRTGTGLVGFVRGDCASASIGSSGSSGSTGGSGSSADLVVSADKTFVRLPSNTNLFLTNTYSTGVAVSGGTVLMMVSPETYTNGGTEYCSLYYNNKKYNAVYADVKNGILSSSELTAHCNSLLAGSLSSSLKRTMGLVGDVRVYTLQAALKSLGYYTAALDGSYGAGTQSAVRNFQRAAGITVDGACGNTTWKALNAKLNGSVSSGGSSSGGSSSGSVTVTDFGVVNKVVKADWDYDNAGIDLIPKGSYATVMDIETGKVFKIYRWSGAYHADCVPASAADTRTMCEIVGFPYNSNHPNSSQLEKIKADGDKSTVTYTWPDFKNAFGGAKNIGSAWDARAALVNVNGTVYPVGIYGFPHGFNGTDSFSKSKFPSGQYFYAGNNYYGMMCLHFVGSKTHSGNVSSSRQDALNEAWSYAKSKWPTLCK